MPFRVSIRNVQVAGRKTGGWTENFWSLLTDFSQLEANTRKLAAALLAFKGYGIAMPTARVTNTGLFRQVQIIDLNLSDKFLDAGTDADYPTQKLQIKVGGQGPGTTGPTTVTQWIGAISDLICVRGGVLRLGDKLSLFNAFAKLLMNDQWAIYTLDRSQPRLIPVSITIGGIVVTTVAHGLAANDKVRLSKTNVEAANRIWRVQVNSDTSITLIGFTDLGLTIAPKVANASLQKQVKGLSSITSVVANVISKHNVGRPSDLLTGRRSTR